MGIHLLYPRGNPRVSSFAPVSPSPSPGAQGITRGDQHGPGFQETEFWDGGRITQSRFYYYLLYLPLTTDFFFLFPFLFSLLLLTRYQGQEGKLSKKAVGVGEGG